MRAKFSDLSVQKFPPGTYMDTKTPAFGLRVGKTRKTWLVVRGEGRIKVRLGHYPAMSLAEARKRALVTLGSPMKEKVQISFPEAVEAFLALPRWRPQSLRVLTCSLGHFSWKRQLDKITHEDVAQALEAIKGKSARAHALKDIRTFFNWCVPRYLASSPCQGLKMDAQPSRERVLTNDEIKAIWKATEPPTSTFGTIVRLLLLTGQRKMEIGKLKWEYITKNTITLPPEVTKNGREHTFPFSSLVRNTIFELWPNVPEDELKGYLFRSAKDTKQLYNGYTFHLKQLQKASGTGNWTLHDLRRTFATKHAEIGTPIHIIEQGDRAFYWAATDAVTMPLGNLFFDPNRTENYYSTLMHELCHWSGGPKRLAREMGGKFGNPAYAFEELVAELGAAFLCARLGISNTVREDHAQYLKNWLQALKNDKKFIFSAAAQAQLACDYLLQLADEANTN